MVATLGGRYEDGVESVDKAVRGGNVGDDKFAVPVDSWATQSYADREALGTAKLLGFV